MTEFSEYVSKAARAAGYDIDSPRGGGKVRLAEDAGMSPSSVGRMLAGKTAVHAGHLPRLAEALKVSVGDLLREAGVIDDDTDLDDDAETVDTGERMTATSSEVIAKLRALRQIQKVSAQSLADRVTALGFPISRQMLANWETRRKETVPVDFLILAATALGTDAVTVLSGPVECPTCHGNPPEGFTCNTCGGAS